jgi:aspartyl-tRNA(Asn)/glutamyl-tRNA(Gln) amidotransferase subunit A
LGRFDGVKYTTRSKSAHDIKQVYVKSRTEGFGAEVKRRIMLGNYVLSSGYYDAYYVKAKKLQTKIAHDFKQAFEQCDVMLLPTTYGEAFEVGEKLKNPVSMYLEDMFTVLANIAGIPAISIPYSTGKAGLPLGLQVISKPFNEGTIYQVAHFIEINYKEKAL